MVTQYKVIYLQEEDCWKIKEYHADGYAKMLRIKFNDEEQADRVCRLLNMTL